MTGIISVHTLAMPAGVRKVKANLTTLTGGNAPTVSLYFKGRE